MPLTKNHLVSWSAQCAMSGYSGEALFENPASAYDNSLLWSPISLQLVAAAAQTGGGTPSCFSGTSKWLAGIISGFNDRRPLEDNQVSVKISSYFEQYQQRTINTHTFLAAASAIIAEVLDNYIGIPSSLYSVSLSVDKPLVAILSSTNALEEVAKLAQASHAVSFIQKTGVFTVRNWKDDNSAVDVVIPPTAVESAELEKTITKLPSRIMVRGRHLSEYEAGEQVLTGKDLNPSSPMTGVLPVDQGKKNRCTYNGLGMAHMNVLLGNLAADEKELKGAAVLVDEGCFSDSSGDELRQRTGGAFRKSKVEGRAKITVDLEEECGGYLEPGNRGWKFKVTGRRKKSVEVDDPNSKQRQLPKHLTAFEKKMRKGLSKYTQSPVLVPGGDKNPDKAPDEKGENRLEMMVYDPDLVAEFGVVDEEIDNLYISSFEDLFDIAIRRFQEYKMARKAWKVNTVYLPCLSLYDVVTFTTPNGEEVTGLLTDIAVNYSADPISAKMSLTVESFEDIGATSYTSGNLLMYPALIASNGVHWVSNQEVSLLNGFAAFSIFGVLQQTILTTVGQTYTIRFSATFQSGQLAVSMGSGSVLASSTGDYNFSFVAASSSAALTFSSTGNWFVSFVTVTKAKTA